MDWLRWILLIIGVALIGAIYWSGRRHQRDESLLESARREEPDIGMDEPVAEEAPRATVAAPAERDRGEPDLDLGGLSADDFEPALDDGEATETLPQSEPGDVEAGEAAHVEINWSSAVFERVEAPPASRSADESAPVQETPDEPAAPEPAEPAARPRRAGRREPGEDPDSADERIVVIYVVAPRGERLVGAQIAAAFARHGLEHGDLDIFHAVNGDGATLFSVANVVEPGTFDPATMDTMSTPGVALFMRASRHTVAETAFDRLVRTARALGDELEARVLDEDHSTLTRQTEQHLRDELREFDHRHRRNRT